MMKALVLSLSLLPCLAVAHDRPAYIGSYGINCGQALQCALEITKRKDGHTVAAFVVSDRADFRKMYCGLAVPVLPTIYRELAGGPNLWEMKIKETDDGGVTVSGLPASVCKIDLNGRYFPIGD